MPTDISLQAIEKVSVCRRLRSLFPSAAMSAPFLLAYVLPFSPSPPHPAEPDTKNQWARDDPAFVAVLAWFLIVRSMGVVLGVGMGAGRGALLAGRG
jgi:hypothetical protein